MSEYTTSSGITIKINEDGTITRMGSWAEKIAKVQTFSDKPQIAKMLLSNDNLTCGDSVTLHWGIIEGKENTLTIEQGGHITMYNIPDNGELNISSDILSDDIQLTIGSKNDIGQTFSRRTLKVQKRGNDVKLTKTASIGQTIVLIIICLAIILKFINLFF